MAEPTATQLYNAVKRMRADLDSDNHILTIPEIDAVLTARIEWQAARVVNRVVHAFPDVKHHDGLTPCCGKLLSEISELEMGALTTTDPAVITCKGAKVGDK